MVGLLASPHCRLAPRRRHRACAAARSGDAARAAAHRDAHADAPPGGCHGINTG